METKTLSLPLILSQNGECERCVNRLQESLTLIKGVESATINVERATLMLSYDPNLVSLSRLEGLARDLGAGISRRFIHETLTITDIDCADCAAKLEGAIARLPGVLYVSVNPVTAGMRLEYEADQISRGAIVACIQELGYRVVEPSAMVGAGQRISVFRISGMDCADCALTIERNVAAMPGVRKAKVNFAAARLTVWHAPQVVPEEVARAVEQTGYGASPETSQAVAAEAPFWRRNRRALLTAGSGLSLVLGFILSLLGVSSLLSTAAYALAMVLGGYLIARSGLYSLWRSRTIDMNLLMTIAALGAAAIGEWAEGATVVLLFSLGNTLEGYTMDRARGAIRAIMELAPNTARVRRGNNELTLATEEVQVGDVVVVRPGEKIPMDGEVVGGSSVVNQASVTGESVPVEKGLGDEVFAGTLNERGYLEVRVTKPYRETTLAKIIQLVEEAQAQKAPSQRFVDRFAHYYTPAVIAIAVALALVPWLLFGQPFGFWFYRALVLLVISCPCALVISTPVSIVSGIASAARAAVLIKGGAYLEAAGALKVLAFDKTGTLTVGRPQVTDVVSLGKYAADEIIHLAAAVEGRSEHPLAAAVLRRSNDVNKRSDHRHEVTDFEAVTGKGVQATLDGETYYVGSPRLFQELGKLSSEAERIIERFQSEGKTVLLVGTAQELLGIIGVSDHLRAGAGTAIAELRRDGIQRLVMLTGDNEGTTRAIAQQAGVDEYRAGLLPEAKVEAVKELLSRYGKVGMVGDGVNDAPALAAATVGIAMGAAGTDVALETADIALMADDLGKLPYAMGLSRKALGIIKQNIAFSLVIKALFLAMTFPGWITLWLAIVADMGASLLVTLNGMRLLGYDGAKRRDKSSSDVV
ncbi:MAG: cadmium-translocating P-type ATPase [Chloroflexi bacterium]|nr:cadmium-translocating P-type ATPase [Chloroflexota bacterium]